MNKHRSFQTLVICAGTALGGISAGAQNLFVIDGGSSVSEYDGSGNLVNGSYITGLNNAVGLAFDSSDNLYVSYNSDGYGGVAEYNSSGSLILVWSGSGSPRAGRYETRGATWSMQAARSTPESSCAGGLVLAASTTSTERPWAA